LYRGGEVRLADEEPRRLNLKFVLGALRRPEGNALEQGSHPAGFNDPAYKERRIKMEEIKIEVANLMAQNQLDALVFPHQKILVVPIGETNQPGINGVVASLAGFPSIVVPAGFSAPTRNAPAGVPVGIEFLGWRAGIIENRLRV
jgi:Asp-tRNA(Asn)/Glu-tRNA(Gln) amidotransferase A subunit family amidase